MPGVLSDMFDGGSEAQQSQQHVGVEDDFDVSPEVGVETDYAMSYEDPNGTTHSFEGGQELNAEVGVQATLGVAVDTAEGVVTEGGF